MQYHQSPILKTSGQSDGGRFFRGSSCTQVSRSLDVANPCTFRFVSASSAENTIHQSCSSVFQKTLGSLKRSLPGVISGHASFRCSGERCLMLR